MKRKELFTLKKTCELIGDNYDRHNAIHKDELFSGKLWAVGIARDAFFNAVSCRKKARELAMKGFGIEITQCGKCIEVCPYTKRYLNEIVGVAGNDSGQCRMTWSAVEDFDFQG